MGTRSAEETRKILVDLDKRTLEERAQRLAELEPIVYSSIGRPISGQMDNFIDEAIKNYENSCFRSSIFCCAGAVEYAFRHEIMRLSENPTKVKIEKKRFEEIIGMGKDYEQLRSFTEDAHYLRKLRNKISAHPLYVASTMREKPEEILMEKETAKRDIEILITFLDLEDPELNDMEEILKNPEALDEAVEWRFYSERLLHRLALKAWLKMRKIIMGIYPTNE